MHHPTIHTHAHEAMPNTITDKTIRKAIARHYNARFALGQMPHVPHGPMARSISNHTRTSPPVEATRQRQPAPITSYEPDYTSAEHVMLFRHFRSVQMLLGLATEAYNRFRTACAPKLELYHSYGSDDMCRPPPPPLPSTDTVTIIVRHMACPQSAQRDAHVLCRSNAQRPHILVGTVLSEAPSTPTMFRTITNSPEQQLQQPQQQRREEQENEEEKEDEACAFVVFPRQVGREHQWQSTHTAFRMVCKEVLEEMGGSSPHENQLHAALMALTPWSLLYHVKCEIMSKLLRSVVVIPALQERLDEISCGGECKTKTCAVRDVLPWELPRGPGVVGPEYPCVTTLYRQPVAVVECPESSVAKALLQSACPEGLQIVPLSSRQCTWTPSPYNVLFVFGGSRKCRQHQYILDWTEMVRHFPPLEHEQELLRWASGPGAQAVHNIAMRHSSELRRAIRCLTLPLAPLP